MDADGVTISKVLFVAAEMEARGTNEYVLHMAGELKRRDVEVAVFCARGPMLGLLDARGIPWQTFERLGKIGFGHGERRQLVQSIKRFFPQIVHAQTPRIAGLLARRSGEFASPIVLTMHAPPDKRRAFRRIADGLAGIIATSQDVREELVNHCEVDKAKIAVIPNGIEAGGEAAAGVREIFSGGIPVVGCVGPMEYARGHGLFLRAAARIADKGLRFHYVMAGQGDEMSALRKLAAELGLDRCLTFVRDFSSYADVLEAMDVVVQSAHVDVSGFSMLDAMGLGRPVIAFNTGTACEMIEDGGTGRIVALNDADALAAAIEELAGQPERARSMGAAARRAVAERFNIVKVADATIRFYSEVLLR